MTQPKKNYLLDTHNTYWAAWDDEYNEERAGRSKVHPFMLPLIQQLQLKRPTWEFHASTNGNVNHSGDINHILHDSFDIHDNGEVLASITREYMGSSNVFSVRNHRLAAARNRGSWTKRKNLKDMVPLIIKQVYPRTVSEIAHDKYKTSLSSANSTGYRARQLHTRAVERLSLPALSFLASRWEEFMAAPTGNSMADEAKANYFELLENAEASRMLETSPHWVLVERPRDIIVQTKDKEAYTCSMESLPDQVKMALGLLKMADKDTLINGIGIRTDVDTFFILYNSEA